MAEETVTIQSDAIIYTMDSADIQSDAVIGYNNISWKKIQPTMKNSDTTPQTGGTGDGDFRIF